MAKNTNIETRQAELFPNIGTGMERRYFESNIESRAKSGGSKYDFGGLASRTGQEYIMYEDGEEIWVEEIATGAFDGVTSQDIRVLFNHDSNLVLARTGSGTAKVSSGPDGLRYDWSNDPEISYAKDLARSIERGDVTQSSFGFSTDYSNNTFQRSKGEDGRMVYKRTIEKIDVVYDVSPVTFPASETTEVGKRSYGLALAEYKKTLRENEEVIAPLSDLKKKLKIDMRDFVISEREAAQPGPFNPNSYIEIELDLKRKRSGL